MILISVKMAKKEINQMYGNRVSWHDDVTSRDPDLCFVSVSTETNLKHLIKS